MSKNDPPPSDGATSIFRRDGDTWSPTPMAQGPWNPNHLHGGAICGALGRAIEGCESPVPMRVARMTVEMTRAVPLEPFEMRTEVTRAGRRIQQIEARIEGDGRTLARATALRMREEPKNAEAALPLDDPTPERGAALPPGIALDDVFYPGFLRAVAFERTQLPAPGRPGISWMRLRAPLVEGETPSPFVCLATLCDFTSGSGNQLDFQRWTSINPDLTLHVIRNPRTEWLALAGWTHIEPDGIAQSHATLYDEEGPVARALATLLVERRPEA